MYPSRAFRRLSDDDRGISNALGYILVLSIVIGGTVTILALGGSALDDTRDQAEVEQATQSMTLFDSRVAMVALGSATSQSVSLPSSDGAFHTNESDGWMRVNITNTSSGVTRTLTNQTLGSVRYENGDTVIAYQGGGVWRKGRTNGSGMVSPPEFHYRDATLTLPIVTVDGNASTSGGTLSVTRDGISDQIYPNATNNDVNPVRNGEVNITVKSEFYQSWADYFAERTDGTATIDHSANTATIRLTIPSTRPTVAGGLISGSSGTTLTVNNNAEADSYNSSVGTYASTSDDDANIIVSGDLDVENNGIVDGDVNVGGNVDLDNNAEVHGNIAYAGTYTAHHTAVVDGWTASNSTVVTPSPVNGIIDNKVNTVKDSNDNASESADITDLENEQCGSTCDLDAGRYYLDQIDVEDSVELDTTGGDITLVVDGDIDFGNGVTVDVIGSNRVNVYMEGDLDMDNSAEVTVQGQKAPNFWLYMNSGSSADVDNNANITGVIYGPGGSSTNGVDADLSNNAHIHGAVVGDIGNVDQNFNIHYDEALANTEPITTDGNIPVVTYLHVSVNNVTVSNG